MTWGVLLAPSWFPFKTFYLFLPAASFSLPCLCHRDAPCSTRSSEHLGPVTAWWKRNVLQLCNNMSHVHRWGLDLRNIPEVRLLSQTSSGSNQRLVANELQVLHPFCMHRSNFPAYFLKLMSHNLRSVRAWEELISRKTSSSMLSLKSPHNTQWSFAKHTTLLRLPYVRMPTIYFNCLQRDQQWDKSNL